MDPANPQLYSAFIGHQLLAQGPLEKVALKVRKKMKDEPSASILVFSDLTGKEMDFDIRGSEKEVLERLQIFRTQEHPAHENSGPGRPKLGVISREVSLLPRHWEWLSTQSGGASATLRRLIEDAKKGSSNKEQVKQAQERTYKFMAAIAGNFPNYEEALRALYAKDKKKFETQINDWPKDILSHTKKLAHDVFSRPQ